MTSQHFPFLDRLPDQRRLLPPKCEPLSWNSASTLGIRSKTPSSSFPLRQSSPPDVLLTRSALNTPPVVPRPTPGGTLVNRILSSRQGERQPKISLHRARLSDTALSADTPLALVKSQENVIPVYSLGKEANSEALSKWPAPTQYCTQQGNSADELVAPTQPDFRATSPFPNFLAEVAHFLEYELKHLPPSDGPEGRLRVCRQAFDEVLNQFPTYAPVLNTIRMGYEARLEQLEKEVEHHLQNETVLQQERERCLAVQDSAKQSIEAARREAEKFRYKWLDVQSQLQTRDEFFGKKTARINAELEEANALVTMERAVRREAEENTETFIMLHREMKTNWDAATKEVQQFKNATGTTIEKLEQQLRHLEGQLQITKETLAEEREASKKAITSLEASTMTPEQTAELRGKLKNLSEIVRLQANKIQWFETEAQKKSSHEEPVRWGEISREFAGWHDGKHISSHDIAVVLFERLQRLKGNNEKLQKDLSKVKPLINFLVPTDFALISAASSADQISALSSENASWAPEKWFGCNVLPSGPLSLLPPTCHEHDSIRGWLAVAMLAQASLNIPSYCRALEYTCRHIVDTTSPKAFFTNLVHRISVAFAADLSLSNFAFSLLCGRRCGMAHSAQFLNQCRQALWTFDGVEKSLTTKAPTGHLPQPTLMQNVNAAFYPRSVDALMRLKQAIFKHFLPHPEPAGKMGSWILRPLKYFDIFGHVALGKSSPVLRELFDQYAMNVLQCEEALSETLCSNSVSVTPNDVFSSLKSWCEANEFASEVILGVKTQPNVNDEQAAVAVDAKALRRIGTIIKMEHKASGNLLKPQRSEPLCEVMKDAAFSKNIAGKIFREEDGTLVNVAGQPARYANEFEDALRPPLGVSIIFEPDAQSTNTTTEDLLGELLAHDAVESIITSLPIHGATLVRLLSGSWAVSPNFFAANADAFANSLTMATMFEADVVKEEPPSVASPSKAPKKKGK